MIDSIHAGYMGGLPDTVSTGIPENYHDLPRKERATIINDIIDECRTRMAAILADDQYYCEHCERTFLYIDGQQSTCERCNRAISDDQIVEVEL